MDKKTKNLIKIGIIGDYDSERISHIATNESLVHCGTALNIHVEIKWISTENLEKDVEKQLSEFNGLFCAPGSPYNSLKGALNGIKFARENNYPFIGTCGGFQHAVIEYLVNKLQLTDLRNDEEKSIFITPLSCSLLGETSKILIDKTSNLYNYYKQEEIEERYNCNFGVNPEYEKLLHKDGFKIVGKDRLGEARILELPNMKFYVATLFQPQLSSSSKNPHKLIIEYLKAVRKFNETTINE
jgi:CTP synthase (UTP-ammonia lyase)